MYFSENTRIVQFAAATRKAHDYRHDELCYIQLCESPVAVTALHTMQISVYFVPDTRKTQINGGATCTKCTQDAVNLRLTK